MRKSITKNDGLIIDAEKKEHNHNVTANGYQASGDLNRYGYALREANHQQAEQRRLALENTQSLREIEQREMMAILTSNALKQSDKIISEAGDSIYKEITDNILSAIANDLTFIYDDGKEFFNSELVTKGFIDSMKDPKYNVLDPDGFQALANDSHSIDKKLPDSQDPNPLYFAAGTVHSLQDGFDVMAEDTIIAIQDNIAPAVQRMIRNNAGNLGEDPNNARNPFWKKGSNTASLTDDVLKKLFKAISAPNFIPEATTNTLAKEVYRNRFINNVLKNFAKMFRETKIEKVIQFDKSVSQLHPLIRKMLKDGPNGEFFKSFVIKYETCEQLYNTKFLVDTQKFLYGLIDEPPVRMSNQMNKLQVVIEDYLGLKDNPTWIIGVTDLFLSMPDGLSLTKTSLLSKIPKEELMEVCKIKASDYWNEKTMGKVTEFGENKKTKEADKKLNKANQDLKDAKDAKSNNSDDKKIKSLDAKVEKAEKKVSQAEENKTKIKLENKPFLPNATIFHEEPEMAENQPLLSDAEKADLEKAKQGRLDVAHNFNKYDQDEVDKMAHVNPEEDRGQNAENDYDSTGETNADKFMRSREDQRQESQTPMDQDALDKEALDKRLRGY